MGVHNMASISFCLLLLLTACCAEAKMSTADKAYFSNERRLYHNLTDNLERNVRPVAKHNDSVPLELGFNVVKIIDLDERLQKLSVNAWLRMQWHDPQLAWNPSDYGGISSIRIPAKIIWNPDIVLFNMAHTDMTSLQHPDMNAVVYNDGKVLYIPHLILDSSCPLNMANFPYDEHNCSLVFGSWTNSKDQLELKHYADWAQVDISLYTAHSEWDLTGTHVQMNNQKYDCCPEIYQDISVSLKLKRHNSYYTQVFVAPSVILLFITPTVFWLPPDCNEKMTLGTGIMISQVLMLVMLENYIPAAHASVPVIGRYFLFGLVMVGLSLIFGVMVRNIWSQSNRKRPVPGFLRTVVLHLLGRLLCVGADAWREERASNGSATFRQLDDLDSSSVQTDAVRIIHQDHSPAHEWRKVAVVLDRLLFWLFLLLVVVISLSLLHY